MATTSNITSNYAGKVAGKIFAEAVEGTDTLSKNLITFYPNVRGKLNLRNLDLTLSTADAACGFDDKGGVVGADVILEPKWLEDKFQFCIMDHLGNWDEDELGYNGSEFTNLPKAFVDHFNGQYMAKKSTAIGKNIWTGADVTGSFLGLLNSFATDGDIIKAGNGIVSAVAPVTKANVVAQMELAANAVPEAVKGTDGLVYTTSQNIFEAWAQETSGKAIENGNGGQNFQFMHAGLTWTVNRDLPSNTFAIYNKNKVGFGTAGSAKENGLTMKILQDLSGQARFASTHSAGVQYLYPKEIVWYLTTASNA